MSPVGLIMAFLFFDASSLARTAKRRENYHYHHHQLKVPPPQLQSAASSSSASSLASRPAYRYEELAHHQEEYVLQPSSPHYEDEYLQLHPAVQHESVSGGGSGSGSGGGGFGISYLTDNGLRSIAHGSAVQASSAVVNQNAAGKQAAYVAKSTLAQAAAQAASTAVAVLKGKELLLQRLDEQNVGSHKAMQSELQQLQLAKRSAKAAQYAAQQAIHHVSVLTVALNNAQTASELAQKAASEAASELASQIDMVTQAKAKMEQVEMHLHAARIDYDETKDAVEKATYSAQEAQNNANDAAVHANVELSEPVHIPDESDVRTMVDHRVQHVIKRREK